MSAQSDIKEYRHFISSQEELLLFATVNCKMNEREKVINKL